MPDNFRRLLTFLSDGKSITQDEASAQLKIPKRSIRRYLSSLEKKEKVNVSRKGKKKLYTLRPEQFSAGEITPEFSEIEAQSLTVACLASRALLAPTPFADPLREAHEKFEQLWLARAVSFEPDEEIGRWNFEGAAGGEPPAFDPACFRRLLEAVRNLRPVVVTYYSASSGELSESRRLHPLGFHVRAGSWMLAAFDPGADAVRDFSPAGFREVAVLKNETFDPPDGFDLGGYTRYRFGALAEGKIQDVRLEVGPDHAIYFRRKTYHPTQRVEKRKDGSAVVSYRVQGLKGIAAWVRSWGPLVKVLEPEELVRRVREDAEETIELYS